MLMLIRIAAAALLLGGASAMAQLPVVPGEASLTAKGAAPLPILRIAPKSAPALHLSPVPDSEVEALRAANQKAQARAVNGVASQKHFAVGIVRPIESTGPPPAARDLSWTPVPGGFAAQVSLNSPQAAALRAAIDLRGVPRDVEMVFFGSDEPGELVGPVRVGDVKDRTAPWWSPIVDGETLTVELFVPAQYDPRAIGLRFTSASHLFTTVASKFTKRVVDIGASGPCNVDIKCSALSSSQAFLNTRNAVAQMIYNMASRTYLCSGTLMNAAPSTQVPWFYAANHCFENDTLPLKTAAQMQSVANTLNTLWFFEATACNARNVPPSVQLTGGAQFIYNNASADVLFLRLNDAAPAGSFFSGWDANPIPIGSSAITIHHPQGDLKKVTQGTVLRYSNPTVLGGGNTPFTELQWSSGTTEGGSSGAGLFTFDGVQYLLRGGLWGGTALCTNPSGTDNFSRFDLVYPALAPYLTPYAPSADYTDLWWNAAESGWGLNVIQHANGIIFAVWYTYGADGKRTWFNVSSGTWMSPNTYQGTLYTTSGPAFNGAFDPSRVTRTPVGSATLTFADPNNGTLSYSVNGITGTKQITRIPF
jgi:lysyl endopeptidase